MRGVLLVIKCLVTAGSVTKCDNLHYGLWTIFDWCHPLEAECQNFYFWYCQSLLSGILIGSGSNFDYDKNFKLLSIFVNFYKNLNF